MHSPLIRLSIIFLIGILSSCDSSRNSNEIIHIHVDSAKAYLDQGQFNAAIIESQNALNIEPKNEPAIIVLAETYYGLGMNRQAIRLLEGIEGTTFEYFDVLLSNYIELGKYATTLLILRKQETLFSRHSLERLIFSGKARIGLQDIAVARNDFEAALAQSPESVEAQLGLVRIEALSGHLEISEQMLNEILAESPRKLEALLMMAALHLRQGRTELAESMLTDAISVLPAADILTRQRAELLQALIRLLAYQGRSGEALIYQQMLSDAFPNADNLIDRMSDVAEKIEAGEYDAAFLMLDEVDSLVPENETTGTLRGVVAFLRGDDQLAQDMFVENVDLEIATPRTLEIFATNQLRLNQPHKVLEILRAKIEKTRNPELLALFGVAALSADAVDEGLRALRRAIDLAPNRVRLVVIYANQLNHTDPKSALKELERAHAMNSRDMVVRMNLLRQYLMMGRIDEAGVFALGLASSDAENYSSHLLAGSFYTRSGGMSDAVTAFESAIRLAPEDVNGYLGLAEVRVREGNYELAEELFKTVINIAPESVAAYNGLLNTYIKRELPSQGILALSELAVAKQVGAPLAVISGYYANQKDVEKAEDYLTQAKSGWNNEKYWRQINATIYFKKAKQRLKEENYSEARSSIFTALTSYPANKTLLGLLVDIEIAAMSYSEARKVLNQLEDIHPASHVLYVARGNLAFAEGDMAQASSFYERALQLRFVDELANSLYVVYQQQGRKLQTTQFIQEWREEIPNSVVATVRAAENDQPNAIDTYEKFLDEVIDSPVILNNLAWLYLEVGRLEEAVDAAKRSYAEFPNNGLVADTYGWALFKSGQFNEAVNLLQQAVANSPEPQIGDHLKRAKDAASALD